MKGWGGGVKGLVVCMYVWSAYKVVKSLYEIENTEMTKGEKAVCVWVNGLSGRKASMKTGALCEQDTDAYTCKVVRGVSDGYLQVSMDM